MRLLVVGAGFAGAVYARELAEAGHCVSVIDKRPHLAGNAYDEVDEKGIRIHRYGPHLFHTNNAAVVDWIKRFGEWIPYEHRVRAVIENGNFVPLPVNIDTINTIFGQRLQTRESVEKFLKSISIAYAAPANAAEYLYANIGTDLTDLLFRPYSKKMWGIDLEDMDISIVKRIPIRYDSENRYFPNDAFQFLPAQGYTRIFEAIFDHPAISIETGIEFDKAMESEFDFCFNSMPIDEYFGFSLGELPYRSIRFNHRETAERPKQTWSVTNYTDSSIYTRETLWHKMPNHLVRDTGRYTITLEEPCDYRDNGNERYYPVKTADGRFVNRYKAYEAEAAKLDKMEFIGRCGMYQYLDMHQVINQSLMNVRRWIASRN